MGIYELSQLAYPSLVFVFEFEILGGAAHLFYGFGCEAVGFGAEAFGDLGTLSGFTEDFGAGFGEEIGEDVGGCWFFAHCFEFFEFVFFCERSRIRTCVSGVPNRRFHLPVAFVHLAILSGSSEFGVVFGGHGVGAFEFFVASAGVGRDPGVGETPAGVEAAEGDGRGEAEGFVDQADGQVVFFGEEEAQDAESEDGEEEDPEDGGDCLFHGGVLFLVGAGGGSRTRASRDSGKWRHLAFSRIGVS